MDKPDGRTGRKPRPPRAIGGESTLAERVEYERKQRGLSYEALAIQMKHHGCPVNASALHRIANGDPPRRIAVDELIALSRIFECSIEELLLPAAVVREKSLHDGLDNLSEQFFALVAAMEDYDAAVEWLERIADKLGFTLELPARSAAEVTPETPWVIGIKERG